MVGLGLPQPVQDGVESFLVEQGPLRHGRVTAGSPVHPPPQGLSATSHPGTHSTCPTRGPGVRTHREGRGLRPSLGRGRGAVWEDAGPFLAPLCTPETPRFLPPQATSGGMKARSGERGKKTRCPRGLDWGLDARTAPPRAGPARGLRGPSIRRPAPRCRTPVPAAGLLGVQPPGHLPCPLACRGSGPSVLSCPPSSVSSARPVAPAFLPSPEETGLLIGGSAAPQRRK